MPCVVQSIGKLARLQSGQLDSFVPMPRQPPVLILFGVPVAQVLHGGNFIVYRPGIQLRLQHVHHFQGNGIQGGGNIERNAADLALGRRQLCKQYRCIH